jgi:putative methionine-R-sulfoxide reductase with GAF domain
MKSGELVAVFDIDSPLPGAYDETDRKYLEEIVEMI